jgi:hypothetical protein
LLDGGAASAWTSGAFVLAEGECKDIGPERDLAALSSSLIGSSSEIYGEDEEKVEEVAASVCDCVVW